MQDDTTTVNDQQPVNETPVPDTSDTNTASMPMDNASDMPQPAASASDNLQDIKSQALKELEPLLGHLDQSPEEKFKAIMMMIQARDNKDLIKDAYAVAQEITDDKVKAQALLDIISEVNYFSASQG